MTDRQRMFDYLDGVADGLNESRNDVADVLNKIMDEITELEIYYDNDYFSGNRDAMFKCNDVLQIIDKHRKEGK